MGKTAEGSRSCSLCVTRPSLLCVAVSVPSLVLSWFLSVWFSPFLVITLLVLVLSTLFLVAYTKKNVILGGDPDPIQDENLICSPENLVEVEVEDGGCGGEVESETETIGLEQKATQQGESNQIHEHAFESPDIGMGSESDDDSITSQDFELNWICSNNVDGSTETSDDSVSDSDDEDDDDDDDDSLIEIALPSENSADLNEEPKQKLQSDLLPESIFGQQGLVELLAEINEMNEEDNLIEIDISKFDLYVKS